MTPLSRFIQDPTPSHCLRRCHGRPDPITSAWFPLFHPYPCCLLSTKQIGHGTLFKLPSAPHFTQQVQNPYSGRPAKPSLIKPCTSLTPSLSSFFLPLCSNTLAPLLFLCAPQACSLQACTGLHMPTSLRRSPPRTHMADPTPPASLCSHVTCSVRPTSSPCCTSYVVFLLFIVPCSLPAEMGAPQGQRSLNCVH